MMENNMNSIISGQNHNTLNPKQKSFGFNRRQKDNCPLNGECLTPKVIYCADFANFQMKLMTTKSYILVWQKQLSKSAITTINEMSNISNISITQN